MVPSFCPMGLSPARIVTLKGFKVVLTQHVDTRLPAGRQVGIARQLDAVS